MTPKEKAEELVDKYMFMEVPYYVSKFEIKLCAIIAVDEVLEELEISYRFSIASSPVNYWQEVKQEIEKL